MFRSRKLYLLIFIFIAAYAKEIPDSVSNKLLILKPTEKIDYLSKLCWQLREKDTRTALQYGKRAIYLADSLSLEKASGIANNYVGVILLHYMYKTKEALPYFHKALETALKYNDSLRIGYSYNNLGDVYYLTGNNALALDYAEKSMDYVKGVKDSLAIAYSHINFGLVYTAQKEFQKALDHFNKAVEIRKKLGFKVGFASAFYQIASVYFDMNKIDTALTYFKKSFKYNKEIDNKKWMALSLHGIGRIFYDREKYDKALENFYEALRLNTERSHTYGIIDDKLGLALVYSRIGKVQQGEQELQEALQLAKELGIPNRLKDTYETISKFYLNIKDYKSAERSLNKFIEVYDSLYSQQQFEALAELQNNFTTKQKLAEKEQALILEKRELMYFYIILGLLVLLVLVILWRYRAKRILTKQLAESNETKEKLFSIISHDLRNSFNSLLGLIDLMKDEELKNEEKDEVLETFESATRSTYSLLENLLSLSAAKQHKLAFHPEEVETNSLLNSVIHTLKPQLKEKSISIEQDITEEIFTADKKMMEIILRNLISNAIKFSQKGETIRVSVYKNDNLCIDVIDNGIGMKEETRSKLFKSEFQESTVGTEGEKGTGIGLNLCQEFIEYHDGFIEVDSTPGEGSKFTVCLPLQ